jgi:hypothetical protein
MFFYLHCGRGFNSLHGGRTKRCLIRCLLCGNRQNNFGPHKVPRHTELHGSRHNSLGRHATMWLGGTAGRPVFIVTCVQSSDVSRSLDWSSNRHGWSWLIPRTCQHLSDKCEFKLCAKFSSHRMKIKGCNCWQWSGPTVGKRAFLSTSMLEGWPCSYWPSYLHCQHAPCDGCYNFWLYRTPVFVAIIAFCGWIVNICQEAYDSLVLPHCSC